ncbi:Mur ligase family protein, partial [Patescibacteria group bacterium]|nr:Mur ligase family protein [Patescibacteria group bacterium]
MKKNNSLKNKKVHVHFMGIGGSALAGVAILAKNAGFKVSGCDLQPKTYYSPILEKAKIKYSQGHSVRHLKDVDMVAVSASVYPVKSPNPEVIEAKKRKILMSWQEFQGRFLQKGKEVLAVAGTHGKSTTTAMLGLALESAGFDPTVEVGAIIPQWQSTARIGHSRFFVCEADEFNHNFLNYSPGVILINNIEMDHPEFFKNETEFHEAFIKFIKRIQPPKILVVNEESKGIQKVLKQNQNWLSKNKVKVIGFFLKQRFDFPFANEYQGTIVKQTIDGSEFIASGLFGQETFMVKVPGIHQVVNALGVIAVVSEMKVKPTKIKKALADFQNLGRRFDLIGETKGI